MELVDKIFFHKRFRRRRETLATMTGILPNRIGIIEEEPEDFDLTEESTDSSAKQDITKNVGERLAHFRQETSLSEHDHSEETQGHNNGSFQPDFVNNIKSAEIDIKKFGEKGRKYGQFDDAKHVTYVSRGRTLITDLTNNRIQLCNKVGRALMVFAGEDIGEPWATALTPDGNIAVTSCRKKCVKILNEDGDIVNTFGKGFFQCPAGIAVDSNGRFIVTDSVANRVSIHQNNGNFVEYLGQRDNRDDWFSSPRYISCSINGDIIVSDSGNHCVKIFDKNCLFVKSFGKFGSDNKSFKFPYGVCTSKYGDIFVADHYNNRVSLYTRQGVFIRHLVTSLHGLSHPQGIALSPDLTLFITHGGLKASEVLAIKLAPSNSVDLSNYKNADVITHF